MSVKFFSLSVALADATRTSWPEESPLCIPTPNVTSRIDRRPKVPHADEWFTARPRRTTHGSFPALPLKLKVQVGITKGEESGTNVMLNVETLR